MLGSGVDERQSRWSFVVCKTLRKDGRLEKWKRLCVFVGRYLPYRGHRSSSEGHVGHDAHGLLTGWI